MEFLTSLINAFFEFEAYVMLPFFIFLLGLIVRMKVGQAFLAALKLGVGFAGVFIVFSYFVEILQPAVYALIQRWGIDFPVLDVGWVPLAVITWSSPLAPLSILFILGINILMILLRLTNTMYIDIWNYWNFTFLGVLVFSATGKILLAFLAVIVLAVYGIKNGDWAAPYINKEMNLKGVTISPVSVVGLLPFAVVMDSLYEKIPWFKRLNFNPSREGENRPLVDFFSEPMIIGVFLGVLLGVFAGYPLKDVLKMGINIAAVMFILPKCAGFVAEGITMVTSRLQERITEKFPGRTGFFMAVDTGILMEHKSVIITGLILMPLSLLLAFLIPGNKLLPLADLPNLISIISVVVMVSRGNVIRSVITGIPVVATFMLMAGHLAPLYTRLAQETNNVEIASLAATQTVSAFTDGGNQMRFLLYYLFQGNLFAVLVIPLIFGMMFFARRQSRKLTRKLSPPSP